MPGRRFVPPTRLTSLKAIHPCFYIPPPLFLRARDARWRAGPASDRSSADPLRPLRRVTKLGIQIPSSVRAFQSFCASPSLPPSICCCAAPVISARRSHRKISYSHLFPRPRPEYDNPKLHLPLRPTRRQSELAPWLIDAHAHHFFRIRLGATLHR